MMGMSRSSLKGAGVKWYYNGLIGKPYGFVEAQRGAGGAPHTVLGVFDQTCMDTYIPFFGLSRNEGLIGCGINPRQKVTCQTDVSGKITPMGTR